MIIVPKKGIIKFVCERLENCYEMHNSVYK